MCIITLTTDFGAADTYVGQMKGAILSIAAGATIVDVCHGVPAQDIAAGAVMLESVLGVFPAGSVHLAVVDPGVGGKRRPLAARTQRYLWVGPDNGLFTSVFERDGLQSAVELTDTNYLRSPVSATFHGRDIFAPAAAHLARGVELALLGPAIKEPVQLVLSKPVFTANAITARIIAVDGFGNLITDLRQAAFEPWLSAGGATVRIEAGACTIVGIGRTFGDVASGEPVAYFGSAGRLEVAVCRGRADQVIGVGKGVEVTVCRQE